MKPLNPSPSYRLPYRCHFAQGYQHTHVGGDLLSKITPEARQNLDKITAEHTDAFKEDLRINLSPFQLY